MNIQVAYFSATGNTRKVAQTIASELGVEAVSIDELAKGSEPIDLLVLGGAVYANHGHGLHASLKDFIDGLDPSRVRKAAVFATGFIHSEAIAMMRWRLASRKVQVADESFFCLGRFALFNMGHPGKADLDSAKAFARKLKENA